MQVVEWRYKVAKDGNTEVTCFKVVPEIYKVLWAGRVKASSSKCFEIKNLNISVAKGVNNVTI